MPLRETLRDLRKQQQRAAQDAPNRRAQIAEWKGTVDALMVQIREYLSEYEQDGSLLIDLHRIRVIEEDIATYETTAIDIRAGSITILIRPIARFVSGAEGRVDIHRRGRPFEENRVMLLRMRPSGASSMPTWFIDLPPDSRRAVLYPNRDLTRQLVPLSKEELERAVDILLK
jgi:hypothetical protein